MDEDQAPDEPVTRPGSFADSEPGGDGGYRTACGVFVVLAAFVVLGFGLLLAGIFATEDEARFRVIYTVIVAALLALAGMLLMVTGRAERH